MTKKVEPGESLNPLNGNEYEHRISEIINTTTNEHLLLQAPNFSPVQLHNLNQTENDKAALYLIQKYFVQRKASTFNYLAKFIIESGQTPEDYEAYMYTNEYNLFFRRTVEEAYADGLYWNQKETSFIRVWRTNGVLNYMCAANFNMIGKYRRKKHSSPDLVPQEIKDEAISQLKKSLLVNG